MDLTIVLVGNQTIDHKPQSLKIKTINLIQADA